MNAEIVHRLEQSFQAAEAPAWLTGETGAPDDEDRAALFEIFAAIKRLNAKHSGG